MRRGVVLFIAVFLLTAAAPNSSSCLECHGKSTPGMERQHPYAIDYEAARTKARMPLRSPTDPSGFGRTVATDLLVEGKVECASCHIPHEEESTTLHRLRVLKTDRSEAKLCLACHDVSGE